MAQVHDACLLELVEELGNDRVRDLFRELLERALQELIDAELTAQFGVGPHEPTETRTNRPAGPDPGVVDSSGGYGAADPQGTLGCRRWNPTGEWTGPCGR